MPKKILQFCSSNSRFNKMNFLCYTFSLTHILVLEQWNHKYQLNVEFSVNRKFIACFIFENSFLRFARTVTNSHLFTQSHTRRVVEDQTRSTIERLSHQNNSKKNNNNDFLGFISYTELHTSVQTINTYMHTFNTRRIFA